VVDSVTGWSPHVGAALMVLIGLVGFFKPQLFLPRVGIALQSPAGISEARAVFGGLNLGLGLAAFGFAQPLLYTALGVAWGVATLARLWSLAVDGIGLRGAVPGVLVDGGLCLLFLAPRLFA